MSSGPPTGGQPRVAVARPATRQRPRWLRLVSWSLGVVGLLVVAGVAVVLSTGGETDAERACALVDGPATDLFGRSTRIEPDEGDCVVDDRGEIVVVHIFEDKADKRDFLASRRAVEETDPSVVDASVRQGRAFLADDRTTLWVWDPHTQIEFALFSDEHGTQRLIELANRVLAGGD